MKIYLASPYSHSVKAVRNDRFRAACKAAAEIIKQGHICFSPIAHSHPIANYMNNQNDGDYWLRQDLSFLESWADEMWVMTIPGWVESKGIKKEMEFCRENKIPVRLICNPPEETILMDATEYQTAHKCPICRGSGKEYGTVWKKNADFGLVPAAGIPTTSEGWYAVGIDLVDCPACRGSGIVWGMEEA